MKGAQWVLLQAGKCTPDVKEAGSTHYFQLVLPYKNPGSALPDLLISHEKLETQIYIDNVT